MNIFSMGLPDLIVRVFAVLLCLTFHELAHGYVAYLLGDETAKEHGRLTLNPIAHIDPYGLVCMFIAGIGWAKPVPVNPGRFRMRNRKVGMAITALAGPAANILMSFVCMFITYLLLILYNNSFTVALSDFLIEIAIMGIGLGVFNLIPFPPLDGSKVIMPILPNSVIEWTWKNDGMIRFVFMLLVFFGAFDGIIRTGIMFLYNHMNSFVLALIRLLGVL